MNQFKNVIFDLGGVLIDWNPDYVFLDEFGGDRKKMQRFYYEVCTFDWNENQDAGYPLAQATADRVALYPQYKEWIEMYYGRWEEMLGDAIQETVELLRLCVNNPNLKVIALTNWSAETFPVAFKKFDFLQWFEGIVVSGEEKTRKPFPEIYKISLSRYKLEANETVFVDDNLRNIKAAEALGIHGIHFKNPLQLSGELKKINIL